MYWMQRFIEDSCFHVQVCFSLPEFLDFLSIGSILLFFENYNALSCKVQCLPCEVELTSLAKGQILNRFIGLMVNFFHDLAPASGIAQVLYVSINKKFQDGLNEQKGFSVKYHFVVNHYLFNLNVVCQRRW